MRCLYGGGVVLGGHPLLYPADRNRQIFQASEHGLVVGPGPREYLGKSRRHPGLGGLKVPKQAGKRALLITAKIAHVQSVC